MPVEKITSLQNPRVKQLVKLRDRRPRDEAGVFLVEGYREIRRALEKRVPLQELYVAPEWFLGENEPDLIARAEQAGARVFELSREAFAKVAYRERPDGLLAVAPQWKRSLADLALRADPFLLVVEAIEARQLLFGGGDAGGFVTQAGPGSASEEDRRAVMAWLGACPELEHVVVGELEDA